MLGFRLCQSVQRSCERADWNEPPPAEFAETWNDEAATECFAHTLNRSAVGVSVNHFSDFVRCKRRAFGKTRADGVECRGHCAILGEKLGKKSLVKSRFFPAFACLGLESLKTKNPRKS
jgi:hypothetical protein